MTVDSASPCAADPDATADEAVPDGVQTSGVLLAVDLAELRIQAASENSRDLIGRSAGDLIGQSVDAIFEVSETRWLEAMRDDDRPAPSMRSRRIQLRPNGKDGRQLDYLAHRSGDFVMLELFDPKETAFQSAEARSRFRDILLAETDMAETIPDLCERAVQRLRGSMSLNGVGIYAFDDGGNGQIVSVSTDGTYAFPEEGIRAARFPARTRRPLERTRIRLISHFKEKGTQIITSPESEGKIDLSRSLLRAFPSEDEAYLEDFTPAKGFLVMPIVASRQLWGIILCLNTEEFSPPLVDLRLRLLSPGSQDWTPKGA